MPKYVQDIVKSMSGSSVRQLSKYVRDIVMDRFLVCLNYL